MRVAVFGASGVVGRSALSQLQMVGIDAVGVSRRHPDMAHLDFVTLDLLDASACDAAADALKNVTHVIYAALFEQPGLLAGWQDQGQMNTNLTMLKNAIERALAQAPLEHVALLQGTKAYGAHIQPMKIPGREGDPRVKHENFYWLQEDFIKTRAHRFNHSIWRPQVVVGHGMGAPMNMLAAIGAYSAFCRFDHKPFAYPGGPNAPIEATDADLLARAMMFGLTSSKAVNETFNVTNGDVFEWRNVWPAIADALDQPMGEDKPQLLTELYERASDWEALVKSYQLNPTTLKGLVGDSFFYADALFATGRPTPPPALVSTIKLRQAGFTECMDTEDMFTHWFRKLVMLNYLPTGKQ